MPIFLYNSLTKKKEEFLPQVASEIRMYTCGVTVYDDCHVGHARSLYIFDCFKKYMEYRKFKVKMVRNITDVDDKIINRAKEEGMAFDDVRKRYIDNYYRDLKDLEIDKADFEPLATENVYYMVDHVKQLIAKGSAYEVEGDVYFSVRAFPAYGALSGQSIDEMMTAVRIEKDEKKRDPLDFALWKKSKEGEPSWPSPWGPGRPGWHIECSTMSMRYLRTQTLDIHAGGRDLIFPHHENEIAQAEALTGLPFAKYWIHHGLLTIDGKKMSKSLGNFITIQDILKSFSPNVIKMFFLSAHYASPMDFTVDGLQKTKRGYEKIEEFMDKAASAKVRLLRATVNASTAARLEVAARIKKFQEVMDDDFNTAQGLAVLFDLVNLGNRYINDDQSRQDAVFVFEALVSLGNVLGLRLQAPGKTVAVADLQCSVTVTKPNVEIISEEEIKKLLEERREARAKKDFKRADEIRELLRQRGVDVRDTGKTG